MADGKVFGSLEWRCIGPHRGGRVAAVAGHPREPGTFYFGGCAGGVFKTTNGGALWENISDGFFRTAAVGAIAVSESDPNVIYVGTGEVSIRSNVSHGDGVYKSTDGGHTWQNVGLNDTRHIGRIRIHPTDPDTVYVAALGHAWGRNEERGVFRTRDGGRTWEKVLYKSDRAGAADLTMDTNNPRVLYASIWQAQRHPYALHSGGEDSGLWRSTDGGDTWTELTRNKGLPEEGILGKIGVAASPARPGRVWALVEHSEKGPLFRSDDYGATWQQVSDNGDLKRRPWYYMHIYADPSHADTVWILNLQVWKSTDGGKSFEVIPTPHGDNHDLWIDPRDSTRLIEGNDGGACVSYDGGNTWSSILNQPTAQFYHVIADEQVPYGVYGSQQDNWAMRVPSISFEGAISWKDYIEPGGGESGHIAISPKPPHYVYGGGIGTGPGHGRLIRWHPQTRQTRNVTVWPEVYGFGGGADRMKYRFQWTFPTVISPHEPDAVYICSNHVHVSRDDGTSWQTISPDLTRNDAERTQSSGGPITADNSGAEIYCTIFAFAPSPHEQGVFWAGSDDGLVHISRDNGQSWQNITPPDLGEWTQVLIIEPSPHDAATAYLCATRYKLDDPRPILYKTNDYGQTWTQITNGIPEHDFTRTIREDPERRGLLYAGTETGIYVSFDDGANWQRLTALPDGSADAAPVAGTVRGGELPVVPIHDLVVKNGDLVVATHGRSFWILDDVSPLRQMRDEVTGGGTFLFQPRPTVRFRHYGRAFRSGETERAQYKMTGPVTVAYRLRELPTGAKSEEFLDAGKNPPNGVIVHYYLSEAPKDGEEATLAFLDADGNLLRRFSSRKPDEEKKEDGTDDSQAGAGEAEATTEPDPETEVEAGFGEGTEAGAEAADVEADRNLRVPVAAGANRFVWDMRAMPPARLEDPTKREGLGAVAETAAAPKVVPGEYQVRLEVGGTTLTERFRIVADPRLATTDAELAAQYELKSAIRDRLSDVHEALNRLRRIRKQVEAWEERVKGGQHARSVGAEAKTLKAKLKEIEGRLINLEGDKPQPGVNQLKEKLLTLSAMIDESDDAPTQGAQELGTALAEQVTAVRADLDRVLAEDVAAFNQRIAGTGLAAVG